GLERLGAQHLAEAGDERGGVLREREHADATRVVEVPVEHRLRAAPLERHRQGLRVRAAGEYLELDEEPAIQGLAAGAALGDIDLVGRGLVRLAHPPRLSRRPLPPRTLPKA